MPIYFCTTPSRIKLTLKYLATKPHLAHPRFPLLLSCVSESAPLHDQMVPSQVKRYVSYTKYQSSLLTIQLKVSNVIWILSLFFNYYFVPHPESLIPGASQKLKYAS